MSFLIITREKYFSPKHAVLQKVSRLTALSYSSKKLCMDELDFCQNPKISFLGHILDFSGPPELLALFLKNRTPSFFLL